MNAQLVHSKLIYGATFLLTAWSASCFRDAAAVAEDVYNAFEQAGRPVVSCPCPKNPMALLISGYWFTRLLSGELGSEAATARFDRDASLMDVEQQAQCLSLICSLEGVCDPQSSPRVLAWRSRLEYLQLEQSAISEEVSQESTQPAFALG